MEDYSRLLRHFFRIRPLIWSGPDALLVLMDLSALTTSCVYMVIGPSFRMSLVSLSFIVSMFSEKSLLLNLELKIFILPADPGGWLGDRVSWMFFGR